MNVRAGGRKNTFRIGCYVTVDIEQAKAWLHSPEYAPARAFRSKARNIKAAASRPSADRIKTQS
jgi:uncharacterized protein (DUF1330 family)